MAWSSASSARGIVTGAASRSLLTRHTRVDPANGWSRARHTSAQGPPSTGREPCRSYKRTSAQYQWRGNRTRSAYKSRDCRHTRAEAAVLKGRVKHTTDTRRRVVCVGWDEAQFTWRGNRTRSAHKGRYIGTREPIPSSHKGRVTRSAHKRARDGRDVLTDGMGLCIECTRHCQGDGFPKLADQAHQSRYCRHARAESHGRHTGRREWEGSS